MADGTQVSQASGMTTGRSTSKLALLAAFIAGAFAAWIVISFNSEDQSVVVNQTAPASTVTSPSSGAGSQASKPGVPKPNTKPGS